jgi:hypothetical protein
MLAYYLNLLCVVARSACYHSVQYVYIYIYIIYYTGCFKNNFTMIFQMLLCGKCYENFYTQRLTHYPSLSTCTPIYNET